MAKRWVLGLLAAIILLVPTAMAEAQDAGGLTLGLRRDFGYGMGDDIQGRFTLSASGPDNLETVTFYLDQVVLSTVNEAPFRFSFSTGDFALGVHVIAAEGVLTDGTRLRSDERTINFVSAEQGWQVVRRFLIPLLILVAVMTVLGVGLPVLAGRKRAPFELGVYGAAGGAICPRCAMPYARHFLAMNMVVGKLERCPHCGKWAVVPAASPGELSAAEERYKADREQGRMDSESNGDDLRRLIDESRFES